MDRPPKDPGWPFSLRAMGAILIPGGLQRAAKRGDQHGIVLLRQLFMAFVVYLALIGVVVLLLASGERPDRDDGAVPIWAAGILLVGVGELIAVYRFRPTLDCSSDGNLAGNYRTRFFFRVALSNAIALIGFVATFATNAWWLYFMALPLTAIGLAHAAPTKANLLRDQRALRKKGCERWILAALAPEPPDAPPT